MSQPAVVQPQLDSSELVIELERGFQGLEGEPYTSLQKECIQLAVINLFLNGLQESARGLLIKEGELPLPDEDDLNIYIMENLFPGTELWAVAMNFLQYSRSYRIDTLTDLLAQSIVKLYAELDKKHAEAKDAISRDDDEEEYFRDYQASVHHQADQIIEQFPNLKPAIVNEVQRLSAFRQQEEAMFRPERGKYS